LADRRLVSANRHQLRIENHRNLPNSLDNLNFDKLMILTHRDTGCNNTKRYSASLLKLGGTEAAGAKATGIHWHVRLGHPVTYTSEKRERNDHSMMRIMGQSF
jgi:hypothetical protein